MSYNPELISLEELRAEEEAAERAAGVDDDAELPEYPADKELDFNEAEFDGLYDDEVHELDETFELAEEDA